MKPIVALTICAALGSGVVAGVFFAFSTFVMPALAVLPAEQGVAAMQSINVMAINRWLMGVLFGTAALCMWLAIASLRWKADPGASLRFTGCAVYLLGAILVTIACNVPRNEALAALPPSGAAAAELWPRFLAQWVAWNHVRMGAAFAASALLILAIARTHCHRGRTSVRFATARFGLASVEQRQSIFESVEDRRVLRSIRGTLAFQDAPQRKHGNRDAVDRLAANPFVFGCEVAQPTHVSHDVESFAEGFAADPRRSHAEGTRDPDTAGGARCLGNAKVGHVLEPEVDAFGGSPGPLNERAAHPDDHETDAKAIELREKDALSGGQGGVGHASIQAAAARSGFAADFSGSDTSPLRLDRA
jgi:uncharacterized membrane protein